MTPSAISTATPEQQAEVIRACWLAWNPEPEFLNADIIGGEAWSRWREMSRPIERFVEAGAYLSAVEMMVPQGDWALSIAGKDCLATLPAGYGLGDAVHGFASTPALALLAAIAQVKDTTCS